MAVANTTARVRAIGLPLCPEGLAFNAFALNEDVACQKHLPVFQLFASAARSAFPHVRAVLHSQPELIREWLGNARPWSWDCEANTYTAPYAANVPSRAVDCLRGDPPRGVDLPTVDEEYFELADAMMAVASAEMGGRFIVVEVGARYAPWAVRAMTAARVLGRSRSWFAVVVEPEALHVAWLRQHFAMNGFGPETYRVIQAPFDRAPRGVTLNETLRGLEHVDFLDMDAQRGEMFLVQSAADSDALRRVRRVHIKGHADHISEHVVGTLERHGFNVVRNASARVFDVYHSAAMGRMQFRGASIFGANRHSANTFLGMC